jgi:hypothetical protein
VARSAPSQTIAPIKPAKFQQSRLLETQWILNPLRLTKAQRPLMNLHDLAAALLVVSEVA